MVRTGLLFLLSILSLSSWAQNSVALYGTVTDNETLQPVAGCYVRVEGTTLANTTDEKGFYKIEVPLDMKEVVLVAQHVAYEVTKRQVKQLKGKYLENDFALIPLIMELPGPTISASPDTVWGSKELNVADFAFVDGGMLLLTYEKEERWKRQEDVRKTLYSGCRLVLLDENNREIADAMAPGPSLGFYLSYYNEVFLQCLDKVYYIKCEGEAIHLQAFPEKDFREYIEPVIDTIGNTVYYSNYNATYPAFEYLSFNTKDSSYHTLRYLVDEELMQRFRAQYRDLSPRDKLEAFRNELETGIDKEVFGAYMTGFPSTPYFQPLNIPMVIANDTLLIFDHVHDKLIRYNHFSEPLDSVMIDYHRSQKSMRWGEKVVRDEVTGKIFTWYEKGGLYYLRRIDPSTGKATYNCRLSYKYVDRIRIHNDEVYYIYRPFESSQNRFLYSERIPAE